MSINKENENKVVEETTKENVSSNNDIQALMEQLDSIKKSLDETKTELKETKAELANAKEDLESTKKEKGLTEEEFKKVLEEQKSMFNLSKTELKKMAEEDSKNTKEALDAEEKVQIKIPIDPLNPKDLVVAVSINGYTYQINRGQKVTVPESVAELLTIGGYI